MMLDFRNATYNALGTIDLEYNHPDLGWIPYTAAEDDTEGLGQALYAAAMEGTVAAYDPPTRPAITSNDVNIEREKRIVEGKTFGSVVVTGSAEDVRNLQNLAMGAQIRISQGDVDTITVFKDGNNVMHELTPPEMVTLWANSAAYVSAIYASSWVLKDADPIPAGYQEDQYWPDR